MALPDYSGLAGQNSMMPQRNQNRGNNNRGNTNNNRNKRPPKGRMLPVQQQSPSPSGYGWGEGDTPKKTPPPLPTLAPPGPSSVSPAPPTDWTVPEVPLNPGPFTFGTGGLDNPFYDPNATYIPQGYRGNTVAFGQTAGSPDPASLGNVWAEDNPEAYYYGLINQRGYGGMDARSRAAQSMFADYYRGYQAAHLNNSELMWAQYANQQNPNNLVQLLSNDQLGINQQTGPLNWTLRG